ncbi:MAG TPA: RluA family pseudouridine synthase [Dehalococcoidia bacterium]|nr:RluA family pseudouridine synthase [Dehalococcoidia bacterium]
MATPTKPKTETLQFIAPISGLRLDKYVAEVLPQFSRAYIQKLITQGYILVNEQSAKASQRLKYSDKITIKIPPPAYPTAEPIPLAIIYEDKDILVIDKPAGLVVHPSPGHTSHTLVNAILAHCPSLATSEDLTRPGIVHRLDKDTSGLMIIAKNDYARQYLVNQFKSHAVTKGYLVLVKGRPSPEQGAIEAPIGRDPHNRKRMAITETGKEASTQYKVKEYLNGYTLLEVAPRTGRTHQIRVHLSAIGYPVVGDPIYGTKRRLEAKALCLKRQFIHAYRLGFRLPSTNEYREFTCPLPADLKQALKLFAHDA